MHENGVALHLDEDLHYPEEAPYHPDRDYPELGNLFSRNIRTNPENKVYAAVRNVFHLLGMDSLNYGTSRWNPLSEIIHPGQKVLIKPNLVMHEIGSQIGQYALHTHGSIIRAVADYALLALQGQGELVIADSPIQGADFDKIVAATGLNEIKKWYEENGINLFSFYDIRKEWAQLSESGGMILQRLPLDGDPKGYYEINLGSNSTLEPITKPETRFSITCYDDSVTQKNHLPGVHKYLIAGSVLDADVILNIPKLKSHMKVGLTACLKNLVGINGSKDYLPHHRIGSIDESGDEFPTKTVANVMFKFIRDALNEKAPLFVWNSARWMGLRFRKAYSQLFDRKDNYTGTIAPSMVYGGSWYGNDTAWRMVHDLNKILLFADKQGKMQSTKQRRCFSIVDAIVAGEGEGPLTPLAKHCGVLLGGIDSLRVDTLAAYVMGFNPEKIPLLRNCPASEPYRFSNFELGKQNLTLFSNLKHSGDWYRGLFSFKPPTGWLNHIEL